MIYNDLVAFDTRASWGRASATEVVVSLNGVSYVLQCPRPCYFLQRKERTKKERFLFSSFSMMLMMILSVFSSIPRGLGCRAKKTRQNVLTTVEMSFSHLYFPIRLSDQVFCFASFLSIFFFSTLLKMKIGREENRTKLVYAKCYESSYTSPLSKSRSKYISRQGFLNNVAKQNSRLFTRCEIDVGRQNMYFVVPLRSNWTTALDVVEYITPKLLLS